MEHVQSDVQPLGVDGQQRHHLVLQFHRDTTGVVTYDSVSFDGNAQAFDDASGPSNFALRWYPPGQQVVNFQIDGDNSSHGTTAYLDLFSVTGSAEPGSSGWRVQLIEI